MNPKLYIDPNGIVKFIQDCPVEPRPAAITEAISSQIERVNRYNAALSKAKQEAVEFADQGEIRSKLIIVITSRDTLYSLPSGIEVEVRKETKYKPKVDELGVIPQAYFVTLAYIKEKHDYYTLLAAQQTLEESQENMENVLEQDEMWNEIINTVASWKPKRKKTLNGYLAERFTITRNK